MKKYLLLFVASLAVLTSQGVRAFDAMNIPKITEYVTDFSEVLSKSDIEEIRTIARAHEEETGEQAVTILFPSRGGNELADIGLKVFRENGIGNKEKDDGILLLIATDEKKIRIITGYGMEGKVPDTLAKRWIEQDIRPYVEKSDFSQAIKNFYNRLAEIKNIPIERATGKDLLGTPLPTWAEKFGGISYFLVLLPFVGFFVVSKIRKKYFFKKTTQLYYSPENKTLYREGSTYYDKYYLLSGKRDTSPGDTFFEKGYYSLDDWFKENNHKKLISAWHIYSIPLILIVLSGIVGILIWHPIVAIIGLFVLSPVIWILGILLYFVLHPGLRHALQNDQAIIYSANALIKPIDPSMLQSGGSFGGGGFGRGGFGGGGGSSGGGGAGD